jgi:integrase
LAYLRKALSLACSEWELRQDNPAKGITLFPEKRRERFFNDQELRAIGTALSAFEAEGSTLPGAIRAIRLLALTGMRLSEVIGLQWAWIDFDCGCVRLPDAKAGARTVPLGGSALVYLSEIERTGAYVCYGTHPAAPVSLKTVKRFWPRVRDRAELSGARMHDFRHTVGTFSAMTGANAFVVRDVLGHKDLATTDRYVAKVVDPARKAADQVANRIASAMAPEQTTSPDIIRLRNY